MRKEKRWETKSEDLVINVPGKKVMNSIYNERDLLMLMFHICIKDKYSNSQMPDMTVDKVQALCNCSTQVACLLNEWAKWGMYNNMFKYNPKNNSLIALNIKKRYTKKLTNKYGKEYWCIYIFKIPRYKLNKEVGKYEKIKVNFQYLRREFKKQILLGIIDKYMKGDKCNMYKVNLFIPSYQQMATLIGVKSTKTVQRILKELENEGRITKEESTYLRFIDNIRSSGNEAVEQKCKHLHGKVVNMRTGSVFEVMPNRFSIDSKTFGRPRFTILNHKQRMTNYWGKDNDCLFDKWDR